MVASLALAPAAIGQLADREYVNEDDYRYVVADMPDFDQRRANGLEREGRCYCGPTVATNLIAEFSSNGFPELAPGAPDGGGWLDHVNYDTITAFLQAMRVELGSDFSIGGAGTQSCGIGPYKLTEYLRDAYGERFTIRVIWSNTTYNRELLDYSGVEPHPEWLARYAHLDGSIGALGRRVYEGTVNALNGRFEAGSKINGHWQTVDYIEATNGVVRLGMRNSSIPRDIDDIQSAFVSEYSEVGYLDFVDTDEDFGRLAQIGDLQLHYDSPLEGVPSTYRAMVVVALFAMTPKVNYSWSPGLADGVGCIDLHQPEIGRWCPALQPTRTLCVDLSGAQRLDLVQPTPEGMNLMALSNGRIQKIDRMEGTVTPLQLPGNFTDARALAVLGSRHMFVAAGTSLGFFGIDDLEPTSALWEVFLGKPISSIAIEGSTAYCLIPEMAQVRSYTSTESGGWLENDLYLSSSAGIDDDGRVFVSGSHLFVLTNEIVHAYRIRQDLSLESVDFGQPSADVTDIAVDDAGVVNFVVRDGEKFKCESWRFASETWFAANPDHPLHGAEVSERLVADRAMIEIPDVPGDFTEESDELEPSGELVLDCLGDLNLDRQVDGADLAQMLGGWGQSHSAADLDNNGMVDGADLSLMLGAWGACEEILTWNACCEPTTEPGCSDSWCQSLVCASDPYCCETAWDALCVEASIEFCGSCP